MYNLGLTKKAMEDQTEVIKPEDKDTNTNVLCNSDCSYSQNPEKLCMLRNLSLTMMEPGQFSCAQYRPVVSEEQAQPDPKSKKSTSVPKGKGEIQSDRQIGLSGAKTKE